MSGAGRSDVQPLEWNDDEIVLSPRTARTPSDQVADPPRDTRCTCVLLLSLRRRRFLITKRAAGKPSFGGGVTNSFCGHPRPWSDPRRDPAGRARSRRSPTRLVLPGSAIRPVLERAARTRCARCSLRGHTTDLDLDPTEVDAAEWVDRDEFTAAVSPGSGDLPWAESRSGNSSARGGSGILAVRRLGRLPAAVRLRPIPRRQPLSAILARLTVVEG